jgi:hypothetical protein
VKTTVGCVCELKFENKKRYSGLAENKKIWDKKLKINKYYLKNNITIIKLDYFFFETRKLDY